MRNLKLTLAYDGTDYVGWQVQPNGRSVQATIEDALHDLCGEPVQLLCAGRTDSGVHALGQVANFTTTSTIPCYGMRMALLDRLPNDIVVRDVEEVPLDFHATYSAKRKHYRYVILNAKTASPFVRRYAWHHHGALDVTAMHAAAQHLLGTHDFRCFETQWPNKATSVRTIERADCTRQPGWPAWDIANSWLSTSPALQSSDQGDAAHDRDYIWFDIVADGFLYNMVRAIVGTLVRVGRGYWQPSDIRRIIEQQDRSLAGETAPPHGLYLISVDYGGLSLSPSSENPE